MRSTQTTLTAPRPLVRLTSSTGVPDDNVPPFLTFADIEMLLHRLIASRVKAQVKELAREETLKARAEKEEQGIVPR